MEGILGWVMGHGNDLINIAWGVVTVGLAIAALTPTQADDDILARFKNIFEKFFGTKPPAE